MTRDDIIRMAREAGPLISTPFDVWCERFAALVAAEQNNEKNALALTVNSAIKIIKSLLIKHEGLTSQQADDEAVRLVSGMNETDMPFGREIAEVVRNGAHRIVSDVRSGEWGNQT